MSGTDIKVFLDAVPAARDKLLIDMVNCLDVSEGHIRVAQIRENSLLSRFCDGVSGKGQRRSNAIAEHQQTSLRNLIEVTTDLARHTAHGHRVLAIVGKRLKTLEISLARVAHEVVAQRDAVRALRADMQNELNRVDAEFKRLDMHTAAQDQLEWIFSRWDAGVWDALPLAGRCYIAINELYWGNFGDYYMRHPGERGRILLETAQHKIVARLQRDARVGPHDSLALDAWLGPLPERSKSSQLYAEGLSWLGDKHRLLDTHPIAYLCTQWHTLGDKPPTPNTIPRLLPARRLADMVIDVFFDGAEAQNAC